MHAHCRAIGICLCCGLVVAGLLAGPLHARAAGQNVTVEFSLYRPSTLISGSIYLYLRNSGKADIGLENVRIDGVPIDQLVEQQIVGWYRLRPHTIRPGQMGELLIRFQSLPLATATALFVGEQTSAELRVGVRCTDGSSLEETAHLVNRPEPVQINFVGFGPNLKRLYIYVQNNRRVLDNEKVTYELQTVCVDGEDVTARSRIGQPKLGATVVPVEVLLAEPLTKGRAAVVTIATKQGVRTGLTLRAIPSEFPIQIVMFHQIRKDCVRDVYNHGATCIGFCGRKHRKMMLTEAGRLGLDTFYYGQKDNLKVFKQYWKPEYPPIKGFWIDEIDDEPVQTCFNVINAAEKHYRPEGRHIPLHTINIMSSHHPHGENWFELGDAVTHSYGLGRVGVGHTATLGSFRSLPGKEYRRARRPFMPYLRSAEIGLEIDRESRRMIGESPLHGYPIMPAEERVMTYGALMEGAKGVLHWGYGLMYYKRTPNWFSKKHWALRVSMGALPGNMAFGYRIPGYIVKDLKAVWDEIGRINAELQTIGPLVAISDVSDLADIARVVPETGPRAWGGRAAEAAALLCGNDTLLVLVLNMNLETHWSNKRKRDKRMRSYRPVDATVNVRIPPWLKPRDTFAVHYTGLRRMRGRPGRDGMLFRFPRLASSAVLVVTADPALYTKMGATLQGMQRRLRAIRTDRPEPLPECYKEEE